MPRIHDNEPKLKTLFTIRAPKPGTQEWKTQLGARLMDTHAVGVFLYNFTMLDEILHDIPDYIVQIYPSDDFGFIRFGKDTDDTETEVRTEINNNFTGLKIIIEFHPMYNLRLALEDLCAWLVDIATTYSIDNDLALEVDESYYWIGGSVQNLLPIMQRR